MPSKRKIDHIVIHHAVTPNGDDRFNAAKIDDWHRKKGWGRNGYHFVGCIDGTIELGRPVEQVGAHVGELNEHSIGICLIGTDQFTLAQWKALKELVEKLLEDHPMARVVGHDELAATECPGFSVAAWVKSGYKPPKEHVLIDDSLRKPETVKESVLKTTGNWPPTSKTLTEESKATEPATKSILISKTFWGSIVTAVAALLPHFGLEVDQGGAAALANQLAIFAGAALAIYGRLNAVKKIA